MMHVRLAKPEESGTIVEWLSSQYPEAMDAFNGNTITLAAENGELRMAMPVQAVLFIWAIPENPKNKHSDTVIALTDLLDGVIKIAQKQGVKNIYFVGTTEGIKKQAAFFGFHEVTEPIYRMVL